MTDTKENEIPPFGDFLNCGIQLMKSERAVKVQVTTKVIDKYFQENLNLTEDMAHDFRYSQIKDLTKMFLKIIDLLKDTRLPWETNYHNHKDKFKNFNQTITPEIFDKFDPHGIMVLYIISHEFLWVNDMYYDNDTFSEIAENHLLSLIHNLQRDAYSNEPDPLLSHIINRCQKVLDTIKKSSL